MGFIEMQLCFHYDNKVVMAPVRAVCVLYFNNTQV